MSASSSGVCKIWDPKTGKASAKLSAHKGNAFWAAYNESGHQIATGGSDKVIYIWDRKNTKNPVHKLIGNSGMVRCVQFINSDKHILSGSLKGELTIYDAGTGDQVLQEVVLGDKDEYEGNIIYCVRGMRKAGGGLHFMSSHEDLKARSWEFDPSNAEIKKMDDFKGHSDTVRFISKCLVTIFRLFTKREEMRDYLRRPIAESVGHEGGEGTLPACWPY